MSRIFLKLKLFAHAILFILGCHAERYMGKMGLLQALNTLTPIIPTLYEALDVVSRENVGMIPAVSRNNTAERAAVGQTVNVPVVPPATAGDVVAGATPPNDGDMNLGSTDITISKSRYSPVRYTGEEQRAISASGMAPSVQRDQFIQAMRTLVNEIESDLCALHVNASRAYGAVNAVPFVTAADFSDFAGVNRILDDNGAPKSDRQLVLGSAAMFNINAKQSSLFKANEAGSTDLLREGIIARVEGLNLHASSGVKKAVAVGTGASSTTNNAGYAVGATTITLAAVGTGTIIAGDLVTFAGDTNIYVVKTGDTDVSNGGTIVLQEPGLRKALPASATAITVFTTCDRNMGFSRSAIHLATRPPALPEGGDSARDRTSIVDPVSGLAFEVSLYPEYRRVRFEVAIAWGVKAIAPRHIMALIGTPSS